MKGGLSSKLLPLGPALQLRPFSVTGTAPVARSAALLVGWRRNPLARWVGQCGSDLRLDRLEVGRMTPDSYGLLASVLNHFLFWFTFRGRIQL
jgi:hypothetical protein